MSVCDVPVIADVCDTMGEGAASLVAAPFDWLAQAMGQAAEWLFEAVWSVFDSTTLVDVTSAEYVRVYNVLFGVAVFLFLAFFCFQLVTGLVHRDPSALSRAAIGLAKSVLGSFLIVGLTALLLEVTDQLCVGIVQATGNTVEGMGDRIALLAAGLTTITIAAPGAGAVVTIFLAGLALSAAAIVWFSMLMRKALLLVAVAFGPLAMAGATWDATKGWFGKWVSFVIALVLSKLVLVVIFLVAIGQVSSPIEADLASVSDPIAGVALMLVAAFAPYITYKFLNFIGFDMYHAMSAEQEAKAALNRPVPVHMPPSSRPTQAVLDGGAGTGGRSSAGGVVDPGSGGGAAAGGTGTASGGAVPGGAVPGGTAAVAGVGATGAGAVAGPVGAGVVAGAAALGKVAQAGRQAGLSVGGGADGHAGAAAEETGPPSAPSARARQSARPAASVLPAIAPRNADPAGSRSGRGAAGRR